MITFERRWPWWSKQIDRSELELVIRLRIPEDERPGSHHDGTHYHDRLHSFSLTLEKAGMDDDIGYSDGVVVGTRK